MNPYTKGLLWNQKLWLSCSMVIILTQHSFNEQTQESLQRANVVLANPKANEEDQKIARAFITQCEAAMADAQARAEREDPSFSVEHDRPLCFEEMKIAVRKEMQISLIKAQTESAKSIGRKIRGER